MLEALRHFKLAPLMTRRDMALLTVIHRAALRGGLRCLRNIFRADTSACPLRAPRRHARHLQDPCAIDAPDYALRSALGAVRLYNLLPDSIVQKESVRTFQAQLQALLICQARTHDDWMHLFSWRQPLYAHTMRGLRDWDCRACG